MSAALARLGRLLSVEAKKVLFGRMLRVGLVSVLVLTAFTLWSHERVADETSWTVASAALGTGLWAAEIFLLVAGATAVAGEAAQGTLKMILPHAYRRGEWIVAKGMLLAAQAALLLAVAAAVALVGGALSGGLGDVTQRIDATFGGEGRTDVLRSGAEMAGFLAGSAGVALASLVATALLGLLLSCLFDGVVSSLSAAFLLFLGMKSAGAVFGASQSVLESVYAWYPGEMLLRVEKLGRGLAERWNEALLPSGLRLCALVAAASLLLSLVVFTRRDLQT